MDRMITERSLDVLKMWTPNDSNIILTHLNIGSLRGHIKDLRSDVVLLTSDVISITETWLNSTHPDASVNIPGFHVKRTDRQQCYTPEQIETSKISYGGVATYTTDSWTFQRLGQRVKGIEYELYSIDNANTKKYILHVYRPPWNSIKDFVSLFLKLIDDSEQHPIVVMGDFNINFLKEPNHRLIKAMLDRNYKQIVKYSTHISGSCIDHVYIQRDVAYEVRTIPVPYSQHVAIQTKILLDY